MLYILFKDPSKIIIGTFLSMKDTQSQFSGIRKQYKASQNLEFSFLPDERQMERNFRRSFCLEKQTFVIYQPKYLHFQISAHFDKCNAILNC